MKTITGKVISNKMDKTVIVEYEITQKHKLYKKIMLKRKRIAAHAEQPVKIGDMVKLAECRPISKTKHFKIL